MLAKCLWIGNSIISFDWHLSSVFWLAYEQASIGHWTSFDVSLIHKLQLGVRPPLIKFKSQGFDCALVASGFPLIHKARTSSMLASIHKIVVPYREASIGHLKTHLNKLWSTSFIPAVAFCMQASSRRRPLHDCLRPTRPRPLHACLGFISQRDSPDLPSIH